MGDKKCARCAKLEFEIADLKGLVATLQEQVRALTSEVEGLRSALGRTSRNSSLPPSRDPLNAKSRTRRPSSGRSPGGQPGHPGRTRRRFSTEEVDRRVELVPVACHYCGAAVQALPEARMPARIDQVVDIPPVSAKVTEYVRPGAVCGHCGTKTHAPLPADAGRGAVGPRLQAVLATLTGRYRLSRREAADAVVSLFGEKAAVCAATVCAAEARTSEALDQPYAQAGRAVRSAPVAHADETSFGQSRGLIWLWVACNEQVSYFHLDPQRSRRAYQELLPDFKGILVTDRYCAYHHHPPEKRQLCWAHLKRDFQALEERGGAATRLGRAGLRAAAKIFAAYRDHRQGRLALPSLARRLVPTRRMLKAALELAARSRDKKTAATGRSLLKHFISLWTFARYPGVLPDNNLAEREIRPAVLWRKGCFGAPSDAGRRFVARMLTVTRTLRRQQRNVIDFLENAIRAHYAEEPAPSLLTG